MLFLILTSTICNNINNFKLVDENYLGGGEKNVGNLPFWLRICSDCV